MKPIKLFLITLFTVCSINLFAQDEDLALERQVNISILHPGISAEFPLSDNFSVVPKVGLGFGFSATYTNGISEVFYVIAPVYNLQGRFYYNGLKRETKRGKALFRNSGNYAFAQFSGNLEAIAVSIPTNQSTLGYNIGIGWGLQRVYANNVLVSWGVGLGYYSTQQISVIGEFTLGINLSSL